MEAHTYRMEPHTNADDAGRYRDDAEVDAWVGARPDRPAGDVPARRPVLLDDAAVAGIAAEAEALAADLRTRMQAEPQVDPLSLFDHVFAEPTSQLREQRRAGPRPSSPPREEA